MAPITINGVTIDPSSTGNGLFSEDATTSNYILVQFKESLSADVYEHYNKMTAKG